MHSIVNKGPLNEMIMKTCPICKELCQDDWNCCPNCGADLSDPDNRSTVHQGDDNTFMGDTFIDGVQSDNVSNVNTPTSSDHSNSAKHPTVEMGDDNTAIVNTTDNSTTTNSNNTTQTNSNNTTNITTINEAQKSRGQLYDENIQKFHSKCNELYKNGLISKEEEEYLHEYKDILGLLDEDVQKIKKAAQQKSKKKQKQLSVEVCNGIRQTKTIIEQNSPYALNRQLIELDSWMKEYEDDALKAYYFQLSSMLEPTRYTERYEESIKDEYWEVFWAYIAYLLQNKEKQAFDAQASLGRLQSAYPEQNEVLLRLAGLLMQNDPIEDIKQKYNVRALNCSQELKLLLDTVDELLQKDWSAEPPIKIREVHSFYADTLFKSFVDTQKADGEKKRKALEYTSRLEREKQIELQRKKGFLLQKFGEVENIEKACQVLGISELTLQDWLKDDSSFNSSYNDIVRLIEDKKAEEDKRARIAKELEERIKQQKSEFKSKYEQNGCDFSKTCSDLNIDRDTVRIWRENDKTFEDGLSFIEREHEKKLQEIFVQFYDSNGCDLQKACAEAGISVEKLNGWRKSYKEFDGVITTIENEHVQVIKEAFVECYKNNDCNLLKTCSETGLDSSTYRDWLNTDHAFADKIKYIENIINKKRKEEEDRNRKECRKKRWNRFKKTYLPIVLSAILLVAICLKIIPIISQCIENNRVKKAAQTELKNQHKALLIDFDTACASVDEEAETVVFSESIMRIENILTQIKGIENSNPNIIESKYDSLTRKAKSLCETLITSLNNKVTATMDANENSKYSEKIKCVVFTKNRIESN